MAVGSMGLGEMVGSKDMGIGMVEMGLKIWIIGWVWVWVLWLVGHFYTEIHASILGLVHLWVFRVVGNLVDMV